MSGDDQTSNKTDASAPKKRNRADVENDRKFRDEWRAERHEADFLRRDGDTDTDDSATESGPAVAAGRPTVLLVSALTTAAAASGLFAAGIGVVSAGRVDWSLATGMGGVAFLGAALLVVSNHFAHAGGGR